MKIRLMTLAGLTIAGVLALSPYPALANTTPATGHTHSETVHDRAPHVHDRGTVAHH